MLEPEVPTLTVVELAESTVPTEAVPPTSREANPLASGDDEEIRAAALQFVRKVSGFNKPSKANEPTFVAAVDGIARISADLLNALETSAPPRYREIEAAKARERSARRFPAKAASA